MSRHALLAEEFRSGLLPQFSLSQYPTYCCKVRLLFRQVLLCNKTKRMYQRDLSERRALWVPSFASVGRVFRAQWLLYVPPYLTFNNSTFCPHSLFMCFVWISEQTAIILLYSINWFVELRRSVFTARYGLYLSSPVVTICTAMFNIQQFYVLPTQFISVFSVDLIKKSEWFTVHH
jgi:hypothetical protein